MKKARTTKMRRLLTVLSALFVLGLGSGAAAQEIQLTGPLKDAPAVRKLRLFRSGRFEVAPTVSFTLLDEYRRTIFAGARLQYNLADWIGIGVWGAYGVVGSPTDLSDQIDAVALRNDRTATNVNHGARNADGTYSKRPFGDQVGKMQWIAAPQVTLTPFRGKLAIFQKIFVDTDAYLHAGVAFIGVQERGDCGAGGGQKGCDNPDSFALQSRTAIAPTFGLGLSFYMSNLMSLGIEYRAFPFAWNRAGFDSRGAPPDGRFPDNKIDSQDQTFKFNQMLTIGVGFHFPTKPKLTD